MGLRSLRIDWDLQPHAPHPPYTTTITMHPTPCTGLCSSQTWQSVQTVTRLERKPVRRISFRAVEEQVPVGPKRCEITSIFVVYGLPALSTGEVLAHECMHAFLRLTGSTELSRKVEEGLCQLMALLWLERQEAKVSVGGWEMVWGGAAVVRVLCSPEGARSSCAD